MNIISFIPGLIPESIINGIAFAGVHFAAYGASLSAASASFIGAAIAGTIFFFLAYRFSVISSIIAHAMFNGFLVSKLLVVVGGF